MLVKELAARQTTSLSKGGTLTLHTEWFLLKGMFLTFLVVEKGELELASGQRLRGVRMMILEEAEMPQTGMVNVVFINILDRTLAWF
jgi:hypothetical protein